MSALPADAARLYATKGKLLEATENDNHAGKMAFDGDTTMAPRIAASGGGPARRAVF